MMTFQKKIFTLLLFFLAISLASSFVFALEQDYPKAGTLTIEQVDSKAVSLTHFFKFATNWAMTACVLLIFANIIYAGLSYFLSSGKLNKAMKARERVKNSFLGLVIIAFAYLILTSLNPQLSILQLERKAVPVGVVLLSQEGLDKLQKGTDILDLIDEKQAFALTYDIADLTQALGDLAVQKWLNHDNLTPLPVNTASAVAEVVNFNEPPLDVLVFWGDLGDDSRVVFYPEKDFGKSQEDGNEVVYFDKRGQVTEEGEVIKESSKMSSNGLSLSVIKINSAQGAGFFKTETNFKPVFLPHFQEFSQGEKQKVKTEKRLVLHPPLSIALKVYSPGIYLYSLDKEELYLNESAADLKDYGFDQKASKIRVQNVKRLLSGDVDRTVYGGKYFAVLFSDYQYQGSSKVFFPEQLTETGAGATAADFASDGSPLVLLPSLQYEKLPYVLKSYDSNSTGIVGLPDEVKLPKDFNSTTGIISGEELYKQVFKSIKHKEINPRGNIKENTTTDIFPNKKAKDPNTGQSLYNPFVERYGELKAVSSVRVFEYDSDYSLCKKVVLCTEEGGTSNPESKCLIYLDPQSAEFEEQKLVVNQVKYPMPLYQPINLPEAYVFSQVNPDGSYSFERVDFNDNIKSIEVEPSSGQCLIGLFDHTLSFDNNNDFIQWDKETTGMSGFFTSTNLTLPQNNQMGKCARGMGLQKNQPCASAIVAYPIQAQTESENKLIPGYSGVSTGPIGQGEARIIIKRTGCLTDRTEGLLTLETSLGLTGSYTWELPWKNNQNEISAIPSGAYTARMRYDANHGTERRIEINDVPGDDGNRLGIQLHAGSKIADTKGCILIYDPDYSKAQEKSEFIEEQIIKAKAENNIKVNIINECGNW